MGSRLSTSGGGSATTDASQLTTGTLPLARLSGITTSQLAAAAGILAAQIASVNPSVLTGSGTVPSAALPAATTSAVGGVKAGSGLAVAGDGTLSAALVQLGQVAVGVGGSSAIDFTSIPGTYSALRLLLLGRGTTAASVVVVTVLFNSDSGANYDYQQVQGTGSSASAAQSLAQTSGTLAEMAAASSPAGAASSAVIDIVGYAGTTFRKPWQSVIADSRDDGGGFYARLRAGIWRSTAAITSIHLAPTAGSFAQGSTATLYGLL